MKFSLIDEKDLGKVTCQSETAGDIQLWNWAPSIFKASKRSNKEFVSCEYLVLDVDDGCTLDEAQEQFKDYKHIIATSKSHQRSKNGEEPRDRFRVILFFDQPITDIDNYYYNWQLAYEKWRFIDEQCKDPARFYYPSPEIISTKTDGQLIEVQEGKIFQIQPEIQPEAREDKGKLTRRTLEFLVDGAEPGRWHHEFYYAASQLREQGYSFEEAKYRLTKITGYLDDRHDIKTLTDVYTQPARKYEYVPKDPQPDVPYISAASVVPQTIEYLSNIDNVTGLPTGLQCYDDLLGGGRRLGEMTAIVAHAKTGKNTFLHWLLQASLIKGTRWGYASRELRIDSEVVPNVVSAAYGYNFWMPPSPEQRTKHLEEAQDTWLKNLVFAPGYGRYPKDKMEEWFKRCVDDGITYFLFDHFHYALTKESFEETNNFARLLKEIVVKYNIYLDIIIQPRNPRPGESSRLGSHLIRGGQGIVQAVDNMLFIERIEHDPTKKHVRKFRMDLARHKLAKPGEFTLRYDPETTRFHQNLVSCEEAQ